MPRKAYKRNRRPDVQGRYQVPSTTSESVGWESERAELRAVLQSPLFSRTPTLTHLLSYLCEKTFAGETDRIKEYSVALDVFDRRESFDQDTDSVVRVQANRLRKRLADYYASEGAGHPIHITIPLGQYVPLFQSVVAGADDANSIKQQDRVAKTTWPQHPQTAWLLGGAFAVAIVVSLTFLARQTPRTRQAAHPSPEFQESVPEAVVGLPVGEEIRILGGASRKYVDHAGKLWNPDTYFSGGASVAETVQHIWRTQDPIIYRSSRQGDFTYNVPLKAGTYELHLHFAETFYGPENVGSGGEGSRIMNVAANGQMLLRDFDVLADSGGDRTAEVKVFHDISPAADGQLHLSFSSAKGGSAMVSAIEILPGVRGRLRPVRIVARDVPYYSDDSHWWSPDTYFKGGQLATSQEPAAGTDDPEFYETERWGHFSYAVPVAPGHYTVTLYFTEHHGQGANRPDPSSAAGTDAAAGTRVFNVFCNGKTVLANLNILEQAGENRPLVRRIKGLEPNAQGKLLLEFVPVTRYATVTAIEVVPE
jgi:hypothetical protein